MIQRRPLEPYPQLQRAEYVSMVAVDGNRVGGDDPLNC